MIQNLKDLNLKVGEVSKKEFIRKWVTKKLKTVYIRTKDNPDVVYKYEDVTKIDRLSDGSIGLEIYTKYNIISYVTISEVLSLECN